MQEKKIVYFLFIYTIILFIPIYFLPLMETTEARYAEIAREMIVNSNFLEPYFNGIKHFHKPPFAYWSIALGIKIFGVNGFGVRFFSVIASLITLIYTYKISILILKDKNLAFNSMLILASSLLFLSISRVASTDIYLLTFTILALYFLFKQIYYQKSILNVIFYSIFLALGFLTKGHIIFLFTLLPYFIAKLFDDNFKNNFNTKEIILGLSIFLIIAIPWYVIVAIKNSGLFSYLVIDHIINRAITNEFHRSKPFWYFIVVFFITFFPYILHFLKGVIKFKEIEKNIKSLYLFIFIPFIIFSLSISKLPTYILPFYPLASIVTIYIIDKYNKFNLKIPIFIISLIFILSLFVPFISKYIPKSYKNMSEELNLIDKNKQLKVLTYKTFLPSISFYRDEINTQALSEKRELRFETNNNYQNYHLSTNEELKEFLSTQNRLFVVTYPKDIDEFKSLYNYECREIFIQKKHNAYLCNKKI